MTIKEYLEKMPNEVIIYPDPILLKKTEEITDLEPWEKITTNMFEVMHKYNGCGLAAPQVGLSYSCFILNVKKPMIVINPQIIEIGSRLKEEFEGCLSLPDQKFNVTRPCKIKVKWIDLEG